MAEAEEGEITENEMNEEEEAKKKSVAAEEIQQVAEENEMLLEELGKEETDEQVMEEAEMEESEMKEEMIEEEETEGKETEGMEDEGMEEERLVEERLGEEEMGEQGMEEEGMEEEGMEEEGMEEEEMEEEGMEEEGMEKEKMEEEEIEETEIKKTEAYEVQSEGKKTGVGEKLEKPPESAALKGKIDDETMKQLEQVEKEVVEAANLIYILKGRAEELLNKEEMTENEEKELEEVNAELKKQMDLFDRKTKEIQDIIANTNILEAMPVRIPQTKHEEDVLPRVVLCGEVEDYVPKIVVCDQKTKASSGATRVCLPACPGSSAPSSGTCPPKKLYEKDDDQKGFSDDNADLEKIKSRLEEDISNKDKILDDLKLNLVTLQNEIRMVSTENAMLSERIRKLQQVQAKQKQKLSEQKKKCPSLMAVKLQQYSEYTRKLEKQLAEMEADFNTVHKEICAAQKERDRLEQTRNTVAKPFCRKK